jgi:hypothetical protein
VFALCLIDETNSNHSWWKAVSAWPNDFMWLGLLKVQISKLVSYEKKRSQNPPPARKRFRYTLKCHCSHEAWSHEPHGGHQLSLFMNRFESRGVHGCGEQWNARDMRVHIVLGLHEDKNPTSYVHWLYYDFLGWDPLYPSFYRLRGVGFTWKIWLVIIVLEPDSISTCPVYKIQSIIIF